MELCCMDIMWAFLKEIELKMVLNVWEQKKKKKGT